MLRTATVFVTLLTFVFASVPVGAQELFPHRRTTANKAPMANLSFGIPPAGKLIASDVVAAFAAASAFPLESGTNSSSGGAVGWVIGGVGVVSLAGGLVFMFKSMDKESAADSAARIGDKAGHYPTAKDAPKMRDEATSLLTVDSPSRCLG